MSERADRFAELAERFFQGRIGPRLLVELRSGRHDHAKRLLDEDEARDMEKRLRQAPRETTP